MHIVGVTDPNGSIQVKRKAATDGLSVAAGARVKDLVGLPGRRGVCRGFRRVICGWVHMLSNYEQTLYVSEP